VARIRARAGRDGNNGLADHARDRQVRCSPWHRRYWAVIGEAGSSGTIELRMCMIAPGRIVSVHQCRLGLVAVGAASVLVMAWRYFARVRVGDPVDNGRARDRHPSQERKQSGENLVRAR
jgi:hypothetical protein